MVDNKRGQKTIILGVLPDVRFYARESLIGKLKDDISLGKLKVVFLLGPGGIGKGPMARRLFQLLESHFDLKIWVDLSLKHKPEELVDELLVKVRGAPVPKGRNFNSKLDYLLRLLEKGSCLIVLDGFQNVLKPGGGYVEGFEDYERFIDRLYRDFVRNEHKGCLIITSREKIIDESHESAKSLEVPGLELQDAKAIFELKGDDEDWKKLLELCEGNPGIMRYVESDIKDFYDGEIRRFFESSRRVTDIQRVEDLVREDLARFNGVERKIAKQLAIEREPKSAEEIYSLLGSVLRIGTENELDRILRDMVKKYLIKIRGYKYTLGNPYREFLIKEIVEEISEAIRSVKEDSQELNSDCFEKLNSLILKNAQDEDYIQELQRKDIIIPICNKLQSEGPVVIARKFRKIVNDFRSKNPGARGYLAANVIALLAELRNFGKDYSEQLSPSGWDFSKMEIRNADLRDVELMGANFMGCNFQNTLFRDLFGNVTAVSFTPQGDKILAGTFDGELRVWELSNGRLLHRIKAHEDWVTSVSSLDGASILTAGADCKVKLWTDLDNKQSVELAFNFEKGVRGAVYASENKVAAISEDGKVKFYDLSNNNVIEPKLAETSKGHEKFVKAIDALPSKGWVITGGDDGKIILWDVNKGEPIHEWQNKCVSNDGIERLSRVRCLAFNPKGDIFASGDDDGYIKLWRVDLNEPIWEKKEDPNKVWSVAFNRDGTLLASGGNYGAIKVWNVEKPESVKLEKELQDPTFSKERRAHTNWVRSLKFCPAEDRDNLLVSGGEDHTIKLWDVSLGVCKRVFVGFSKSIYSVVYGESFLVAGCGDHNVYLWKDGDQPKKYKGHTALVWTVSVQPRRQFFASGSDDRTVKLWELSRENPMWTSPIHGGWVGSVALSSDGMWIASGSEDRLIRVWDTREKRLVSKLGDGIIGGRVSSLVFLPNNGEILSGSEDGKVCLWLWQQNQLKEKAELRGRIYTVAYNEQRNIIAAAGSEGFIKIWKLSRDKETTEQTNKPCFDEYKEIRLQTAPNIWSVCFDPLGNYLYCGTDGKGIIIIQVDTGKEVGSLDTDEYSKFWSVTISPDGKKLAAGSQQGFIFEWDLTTRKRLSVRSPPGPYERMCIMDAVLNDAEKSTLVDLGALERCEPPPESRQPITIEEAERKIEEIAGRYQFVKEQSQYPFDYYFTRRVSRHLLPFPPRIKTIMGIKISRNISMEDLKRKLQDVKKDFPNYRFQLFYILCESENLPENLYKVYREFEENEESFEVKIIYIRNQNWEEEFENGIKHVLG